MEFHAGDKGLTRDGRGYEVLDVANGLIEVQVGSSRYLMHPCGKVNPDRQHPHDLLLPDDAEIDLHGDGDIICTMRQMRRFVETDYLMRSTYPNAKRVSPIMHHKGWTEITFTGSIDIKELK